MALDKNIFARLFPAMAEPQPTDEAAYSDPDREAPSTPTTRRFEMPQAAYSAPVGSDPNEEELRGGTTQVPADPGSTLSQLGAYIGNDGGGVQMSQPDQRTKALSKTNDILEKKFGEMQIEALGGMMQEQMAAGGDQVEDGRFNYGYGREMEAEPESSKLALLAAAAEGEPNRWQQAFDAEGWTSPDSAELPKTELERAEAALEKHRGTTPVDKNKGFKSRAYEAVQNALEGMALAYKANPNGPWEGILAGGAAGGVVGSTANKAWNEQRQHAAEGARLESNYKSLNEVEENRLGREGKKAQTAALGKRATLAEEKFQETKQKNVDLEYDKGFRRATAKLKLGYKKGANPALDAELTRYGIDVEQWDDDKRKMWVGQNLMTFDETGEAVPVLGSDGKPTIDPVRSPVTLSVDGSPFTVSQTTGAQIKGGIEASRIGAQNKTAEIRDEYQSERAELDGKIAEARTRIKAAKSRLSDIEKLTGREGRQAQDEREKLNKEIRETDAELAGHETKLKGLPPPRTVVGRAGGKPVSKDRDPRGYFQND